MSQTKKPWGFKWRSSDWYTTTVVAVGIATDLCTYSIVVPVLPFRLESLGYTSISSKTAYLLVSYSAGLICSTPLVIMLAGRTKGRRTPLLIGLVLLMGSLVMFMLVPTYWAMCIARVIQGASSSMIWVIGLALLCESVAEERVGQHLGFAMSGTSIGMTIGPPLGGVLYQRLGWYAPSIFAVIVAFVDLVGRLLILEKKDVAKWAAEEISSESDNFTNTNNNHIELADEKKNEVQPDSKLPPSLPSPPSESSSPALQTAPTSKLTTFQILKALFGSPRGMSVYFLVFVYGFVYSSQEPTLTLRLADIWNKDSQQVGEIYLAAVIPTFFSAPLFGTLSDKFGPERITTPLLIFGIPWYLLLYLKTSLAGFIVFLAFSSVIISGVVAPVTADLDAVAKLTPGLDHTHIFGSFNMSFSVASAVGALVSGPIYDHVKNGWLVLCIIWACLLVISIPFAFCFVGETPLLLRMRGRLQDRKLAPAVEPSSA